VTDDEIIHAYPRIASSEGIFVEPASAASLAGLMKLAPTMNLSRTRIVCVFTGHGLKDPGLPAKYAEPPMQLPADLQSVQRALFG